MIRIFLLSLFGWAAALSLFVPCQAQATSLELQRFDRPYIRQFVVSEGGQPIARIRREKWRQIWRRHYVSFAADGAFVGSSHQPLSWSGLYWPSWSDIVVRDATDAPIAYLKGELLTLMAASYQLLDRRYQPVARLTLDDHAQVVLVTGQRAHADATLFGQATRIQQASGGRDSWALHIDDAQLPHDLQPAWPLILAFFADSFDQLTRSETSK